MHRPAVAVIATSLRATSSQPIRGEAYVPPLRPRGDTIGQAHGEAAYDDRESRDSVSNRNVWRRTVGPDYLCDIPGATGLQRLACNRSLRDPDAAEVGPL